MDAIERVQENFAYKGTWEHGREYVRGNFVSQDGSIWHAQRDSKGARPGDGDSWKLAVRHGRDGKDAPR